MRGHGSRDCVFNNVRSQMLLDLGHRLTAACTVAFTARGIRSTPAQLVEDVQGSCARDDQLDRHG